MRQISISSRIHPLPAIEIEGRRCLANSAFVRRRTFISQEPAHPVCTERYLYIRYANGDEELYNETTHPNEWTNLASAFLNHPASYRYPTRWNVRTYGLFTANPFAQHDYDPTLPDGTTTLKSGEHLKLHHRFIFHTGDAATAKIEAAWQQYAKETK